MLRVITGIMVVLLLFIVLTINQAYCITVEAEKEIYYGGEWLVIYGVAEPNSLVSIVVVNPQGVTVYVDQVKSGADGSYERTLFKFPETPTDFIPYGTYTIEVTDPSGTATTTVTYTRSYWDGQVVLNRDEYTTEDEVYIYVYDPDANTDPNVQESLTVIVSSNSTPTGMLVTLIETDVDSGNFTGTLRLSSRPIEGRLFVSSGDILTVAYTDRYPSDYPETGASKTFTAIATIIPAKVVNVAIEANVTSAMPGDVIEVMVHVDPMESGIRSGEVLVSVNYPFVEILTETLEYEGLLLGYSPSIRSITINESMVFLSLTRTMPTPVPTLPNFMIKFKVKISSEISPSEYPTLTIATLLDMRLLDENSRGLSVNVTKGELVIQLLVFIKGDINNDGKVDLEDVGILAESYGTVSGTIGFNPEADLNGDGKVDYKDLAILARNYGRGVEE